MKKNVLALSIATMIGGLGFSGAAMAKGTFTVNESGTGAIQIVPYFTAQDGNATVLHVVNTDTTDAKAVKIRFRGASNSDDLLDFQVFLSPGDVWTGMASADAEGRLQLVTNDNSCTLPESVRKDGVTKAPVDRLTNKLWDTDAKKFAQTREGYIEILEMATIKPATPLFTAVKHVKKGGKMEAPCTLSTLSTLDSVKDGGAAVGLGAPGNSLSASWYIINVANSTTFSGSATALVADAAGGLRPVYAPQKAGLTTELGSADPLFKEKAVDSQDFDYPDLSTSLDASTTDEIADAATQAANLSSELSRLQVFNQFYHDAVLNASTDWVFSMPTRRYLVAANYAAEKYVKGSAPFTNKDGFLIFNEAAAMDSKTKFAANDGTNVTAANVSVNEQGQICVIANGQVFYDREEDSITDGHVVSPGTAKKLNLCGEVSVATFGAKSPLGAAIARSTVDTGFSAGWGFVNFGDAVGADVGVPVLGAAFTAASNPNAAAGMVGNYGITWPHFYTNNK